MNEVSVTAHLERIGLPHPDRPDLDYLRRLHSRHLHAVPFENLSIHLGEDVPLNEDALFDKIVTRRRGGYCYELNGLLAALLRALGYQVSLLAVRVHGDNGFSPPFDHLALRVDLDEPWLVDVGFGRHSEFPLRLDYRDEQKDPGGVFRIEATPDGDLDVYRDGTPAYRIEQRPRELADFTIAHGFQRFSPTSHFTRSPFCTILTDDGMITLAGRKLITTTQDGVRTEETLEDDAQVLAAYRTHFGLTLARVPDHSQDV
ncbi:arylamine N-acetyltransferase family protein [Actinospica robiniae]|uniref:Arylamine N-acetyltransferase n=1 Tax=Actinospica robiniae DSM 44927 TaxID=479430 RepID=W9DZ09_9ACTN|nr:arylamine N-acetyltransferase [Actinospica robiniae]ETA71033.1 arylamine N-acetyltransferase [Actinospica robiniae DSM 44927]